jgi:RimJ/RimL family protein N-acetyltransferase
MHVITPPTLETARLRLRPLVIADAVALKRIQSDPEHMRFYPHPFAARESREWIEGMRSPALAHADGSPRRRPSPVASGYSQRSPSIM